MSKRLIYIEVMEPLLKYVGLCVWFWLGGKGDRKWSLCRCSFLSFLPILLLYLFPIHSSTLSFYISFVCVCVCVSLMLFLFFFYLFSQPALVLLLSFLVIDFNSFFQVIETRTTLCLINMF